MLDATQLSYLTIVKWDNPLTPEAGEKLSCSTTLSVDLVDEMPAAELNDLLARQAIAAWRHKVEQRMGFPPPDTARVAVTVILNAATGRPIAHLCTLVEDEADEPKPE